MITLKALEEITLEDLQKLIDDKILENRYLDYKRDFGDYTNKIIDLLKDITAFLNSDGGDLVFGIDEKDGYPDLIRGVQLKDVDRFKNSIEQQIALCIQPKTTNYTFKVVPVKDDKVILILRIHKNFNTPFMIKKGDYTTFYYRGESGNLQMDHPQIKSHFQNSVYDRDAIKNFIYSRYQYISSEEFPCSKLNAPKIIIHSIPTDRFYKTDIQLNLKKISKEAEGVFRCYIPNNQNGIIYNIDGSFQSCKCESDTNNTLQIFRDGTIEYTNEHIVSYDKVGISEIDGYLLNDFIKDCISFQKQYMYSSSYLVAVSILNAKGMKFILQNSEKGVVYNRSTIQFPMIEINSNEDDFSDRINPLRDILWSLAGTFR
jgi:hypothetical protein